MATMRRVWHRALAARPPSSGVGPARVGRRRGGGRCHSSLAFDGRGPGRARALASSSSRLSFSSRAASSAAGYPLPPPPVHPPGGGEDDDVRVVGVDGDGARVTLRFPGDDAGSDDVGGSSSYHASWLWSNDPRRVALPSGQRASTPGRWRARSRPGIRDARIVRCDVNVEAGRNEGAAAAEGAIDVPGPTPEDSCHPLPIYGNFPAWMRATTSASDAPRTNRGTHRRPYLQIKWSATPSDGDDAINESIYDVEWLRRLRYDDASRLRKLRKTEVRPLHAVRSDGPPLWYSTPESATELSSLYPGGEAAEHDAGDGLMHVDYRSIIGEDGQTLKEGLFRLLHSVFRDGAAVVTDTPFSHRPDATTNDDDEDAFRLYRALETMPEDDLPVHKVARAMSGGGAPSHGSLYGDIFHVRAGERGSSNLAYTSDPLPPHQDLPYYESPPGMQLLHCAAMGSGVSGGESVLIDALAAAHRLREVRPASFDALAACHATFVKQRDGAGMTYRRPHVALSGEEGPRGADGREIVAVHWSPPFEGPVCLPPGQVDGYYEAYADFERLVGGGWGGGDDVDDDDELSRYAREHTWNRRLGPGDMLVFNNRRMLHGRHGFSAADDVSFEDGQRHLVGCYTNIDDTLNLYRVLLRERGNAGTSILNVGNGTNIVP